jgi:fatty-acid peroxygenase
MGRIPRDASPDATLALLRDPYGFVGERCRRYGADLFQTRLLLRPTICMSGPRAAQLFYDETRFTRIGASPGRVQKTLFGRGGVQGLDGAAHRHRKQLFMSLMGAERINALAEVAAGWARIYAGRWASMDAVVLYPQLQRLLTQSVCEWAGVPLPESQVAGRPDRSAPCSTTPAGSGPVTGRRGWRAGPPTGGRLVWSGRSGPGG